MNKVKRWIKEKLEPKKKSFNWTVIADTVKVKGEIHPVVRLLIPGCSRLNLTPESARQVAILLQTMAVEAEIEADQLK